MNDPIRLSLLAIGRGLNRPQVVEGAASAALDLYYIIYRVVLSLKQQGRAISAANASHLSMCSRLSHTSFALQGTGATVIVGRCRTGLVAKLRARRSVRMMRTGHPALRYVGRIECPAVAVIAAAGGEELGVERRVRFVQLVIGFARGEHVDDVEAIKDE
jgi:hypothetical protein